MRPLDFLPALLILLTLSASACAFNYEEEAQNFDERIDNLVFIVGASRQPSDEGDEMPDLAQAVESLNALKQDYREMTGAMTAEDINKAQEKRDYMLQQILDITAGQGLEYETRDIDKIIGPWSGYEIHQIRQKLEREQQQKPQPTETATPVPEPTRVPVQAPTPIEKEEIGQTAQSQIPNEVLPVVGAIAFILLILGLYKFFKKRRYYNYCLLLAFTIVIAQAVSAGCVGNQCGDITSARVWTTEEVSLENGATIPANTLICEADISEGFWNTKCNEYCDDPDCLDEGFAEQFQFRVEMTVKNTSDGTQGNFNTLIDGESLAFMHSCGSFSVRLTPGEEKTYTKNNCTFRYNEHMDPNYPSLDGWFTSRGTCARSLYCFKSDHHFTCKSQMFKIADQGNWAYVTKDPIAGNEGQGVKGAYGIRVVSPDPDLYPGNKVYADIGENVQLEAAMKNFGPVEVCVKAIFAPYPNWLDNLNPVQGYSLPNYDGPNWEYFPLAGDEGRTKSMTFQPVIPGLWRIDWRHYSYYEKDPSTGACGPNPQDSWGNAASWVPYTQHTIQVRGPDAYLHGMYPPTFYFPPEEGSIGVETHLTVTTAYGTEAFTDPGFPLLVDMYYFDSGYLKAREISELPLAAGLRKADVPVLQEFETDRILGVDQIIAVLKYDPALDIPGVSNDALMNEWMAKAGHQGSGSWCGEKCEYGYGTYRIPVDFVKFIDLEEQFGEFYHFDETEGYFYMEMNPFEGRDLQLHMENPYLAPPDPAIYDLSATQEPDPGASIITFHSGIPDATNQTSIAEITAATSDDYVTSTEYWIKIIAPASGVYDINVEATPQGKTITDRVRIRLVVNASPTADFRAVPREGVTPLIVDFFDQSEDDGTIQDWHWDFGDGTTNTGTQNPAHTYHSADPKTVTLTVWDNHWMSDSTTKEIKPYTFASVEKVYAFDRMRGDKAAIAAECNKSLPGTFEIVNIDTKEPLFQSPAAYICNSGLLMVGPGIERPGQYSVTFKFDQGIDCTTCQKTKYFTAYTKMPEIPAPENPFLEAGIAAAAALSLIFVAKRKKANQ